MTDDEFKEFRRFVATALDNIQKKEEENQKLMKSIVSNTAVVAVFVVIITALFVYGYFKIANS
ncbi:MAG: hypothetical protein IJ060_11055 [Oscillospiraceae bacterium]|nr:hypothetical protein [Oscillospiraceae bacterium]